MSSPLPPLGLRHSTLFSKEKELNFFSSILVGPFSSFLLPAPYVCRLLSFVFISFHFFLCQLEEENRGKGAGEPTTLASPVDPWGFFIPVQLERDEEEAKRCGPVQRAPEGLSGFSSS